MIPKEGAVVWDGALARLFKKEKNLNIPET